MSHTYYLSNETHNPAAVPKITSNFVPDCISLSVRRKRKEEKSAEKKKEEKIIFDA